VASLAKRGFFPRRRGKEVRRKEEESEEFSAQRRGLEEGRRRSLSADNPIRRPRMKNQTLKDCAYLEKGRLLL